MLSLLVFIGEAVRDAFDPRKTFWRVSDDPDPARVKDLSVAFGTGRQGRARGARQLRHQARRDRGAGGRIGLRQVGDRPLDAAAAALSGRAAIPRAASASRARSWSAPRARDLRGARQRISMIFQEPMTSLNPLHTIERQVARC
jgi:ABC-type dipeptide/oligopeptide/nickel transport system ATPase component